MLALFTPGWLTLFFAACVTARLNETFTLKIPTMQKTLDRDCKATCAPFVIMEQSCHVPRCRCYTNYLRSQGDCLLCRVSGSEYAAFVQLFLDAEMNQCNEQGFKINFQLQLPPVAARMVQLFDHQTEQLKKAQIVFLVLQVIGGHIGLVIVVLFAAFSRKIHREPIFFNFCLTWIFSSVAYSILLYRGTTGHTIVNPLGNVHPLPCLLQASFVHGTQVMTACSTMALVVQLWLGIHAAVHGCFNKGHKLSARTTILLLTAPYILFLALALPVVMVGQEHVTILKTLEQRALPGNFYCLAIESNALVQLVYAVTLVIMIVTIVFDGLIIHLLYRQWCSFRQKQIKSPISLSLLRVIIFSIYRIVVVLANGTVLNRSPVSVVPMGRAIHDMFFKFGVPVWVDMLQAAAPLVAFLVLGLNSHMLSPLMFWHTKSHTGASAV